MCDTVDEKHTAKNARGEDAAEDEDSSDAQIRLSSEASLSPKSSPSPKLRTLISKTQSKLGRTESLKPPSRVFRLL